MMLLDDLDEDHELKQLFHKLQAEATVSFILHAPW